MKSVKLYFAGSAYPEPLENRLVSYAYPDQLKNWFKLTGDEPGRIILDSGAFSAWKSGTVINLDDYIEFAHTAIKDGEKLNKIVRPVNLDVIPGSVGKTSQLNKLLSGNRRENLELIDDAAKRGHDNMVKMLDNGITPIHVFHQGETWKWLDKMVEKVPYIGVSPANDMPVKSKRNWMYSVFNYLHKNGIKVDTHGFAVFDSSVILEFPWTSVDATTPLLLAGYGKIMCPSGGFSNPDYSIRGSHLVVSERRATLGHGDVTEEKLKQLLPGCTFKDLQDREVRVKYNVKFVLGLQDYINSCKKKTEFTSRESLFT